MSKRNLNDERLVVDVEATCWDETDTSGQFSEIIEIGLVMLNRSTLEITNKRSILVKPEYSEVSPFCTNLTTITQDMVDQGILFAEACEVLRKEYRSHKRMWASWGDYDRKMFESMSKLHDVKYPFGSRHINLKTMYGLMMNMDRDPGMPQALDNEGIKLTGTHHRGHDDAENIADIARAVIERSRIKYVV